MSFLEALQAKKTKLKSCETIVTTATGERFKENAVTQEIKKLETDNMSYGFVVDTKPDLKPACICKHFLYLGSQDSVSLENITQYQLTHILSLGIECPLKDLPDNINTLYIACLDLPESNLLEDVAEKSFEFIESARRKMGGSVLVHCNAGVSRSASIVIAYLIRYEGMDFETAYRHVKSQRECIQPNAGFIKQLRDFK